MPAPNNSTDLIALGSRVLFSAATAGAGYLLYRCQVPPHTGPTGLNLDNSKEPYKGPAVKFAYGLFVAHRTGLLGLSSLQALVSLATSSSSLTTHILGFQLAAQQICPRYLTWNKVSAWALPVIAISSAVRLAAMNELGRNFTFEIRDPDRLNTGGLYRYMQHPSYSTAIVAFCVGTWWFFRVDGVAGAFLPPKPFQFGVKWQWMCHLAYCSLVTLGLGNRIWHEEKMLHEKFGVEWEEWHRRTARLIPFIL